MPRFQDQLKIPNISTEEDVVLVIDELKYRLQLINAAQIPLAKALDAKLNDVIEEFHLGEDQHAFAALPKEK